MSIANRQRFSQVYTAELQVQLDTNPGQYAWPASELNDVVDRMMLALIKGSANKDSAAIKRTCKALGIKHTYTAIKEYLGVKP